MRKGFYGATPLTCDDARSHHAVDAARPVGGLDRRRAAVRGPCCSVNGAAPDAAAHAAVHLQSRTNERAIHKHKKR